MAELKPCPFCGEKENIKVGEVPIGNYANLFYKVTCRTCGASSGLDRDKETIIKAWNRRAYEHTD